MGRDISHDDSSMVERLIAQLFTSLQFYLAVLNPKVAELLLQSLHLGWRSYLHKGESSTFTVETLGDGCFQDFDSFSSTELDYLFFSHGLGQVEKKEFINLNLMGVV